MTYKTSNLDNSNNTSIIKVPNQTNSTNFTNQNTIPIINPYTPKSASIKNSLKTNFYTSANINNNTTNFNNTNLNSNAYNTNFSGTTNFGNSNINNNNTNFIIDSNHKSLKNPENKPVIFISARVHPGETPSSFLMNGLLRFLVSKKDPRAEILRKAFVFKIIPIINVDGVSRGFYRYDTNSLNMNRHYISPGMKMQPEIYAIKKIFLHFSQQGKIKYYFDLHAHASSRGLFLFGNSLDFLQQIENKMLPKLIELNCEDLCFANCNFSEKSMKSKDRGDKYSKEGTGRVHFNKICDIIHCYTVEASYYRGIRKNDLKDIKPVNFNLLIEKEQLKVSNKENNSKDNFCLSNTDNFDGDKNKEVNNHLDINNNINNYGGNCVSLGYENENSNLLKKANEDKISKTIKSNQGNIGGVNDINNKNSFSEKLNEISIKENLESESLLQILSKYFKIEIEKAFFGDKGILKKIIKKPTKDINENKLDKNDYLNKEKENEEYEKIRNIKLNINLSFDTLDKSKENNNNSSMDSSMCNVESEGKKTNSLSNAKFELEKVNCFENNKINEKDPNIIFDNIDQINTNNQNNNTIEKYTENEIIQRRKTKYNSISNFSKTIKLNSNNNSIIANSKKINNISPNNSNSQLSAQNLRKTINGNSKNTSKIQSEIKQSLIESDSQRLSILKQIENFENIDFEVYKKLNFFDEKYFLEANSFKNPNNIFFSQCLKEEENFYTPIAYEKMGVSLLIAVLDYEKLNPFSRLGNSDYKSIESLRISVANHLFNSEEKYKASASCQNYIKNLDSVKKFESLNEKIIQKLNKDKAAKRSNSMSVKKIINPYNYLYQNSITNEDANNAKRTLFNVDAYYAFINSINVNNFNFNISNFANSQNTIANIQNNDNSTRQGFMIKKSLDNYIEENVLNMLNNQRPNFFNSSEAVNYKRDSKSIRDVNQTLNTVNFIKEKSNYLRCFLDYYNSEAKNKNITSINNFSSYINQTNSKNNNLIKINYESNAGINLNSEINADKINNSNKNSELYDLAFANYQLAQKAEYTLDIPTRLKYQMNLLKNKSSKQKTNKAAKEINEPFQLETEENEEIESEILQEYFSKEIKNSKMNKKKNPNLQSTQNLVFTNTQFTDDVNFTNKNHSNTRFSSNKSNNFNTIEEKRTMQKKEKSGMLNINNYKTNNLNFYSRKNSTTTKNLKGEVNKNNEQIVISGAHAAKIRMLKGLDLKGEKKKSDAFLNVKCVGLKAEFLQSRINNNNFNNSNNKVCTNEMSKNDNICFKIASNNPNNVIINKNNNIHLNKFRKTKRNNFPMIDKGENK